MKIALAGAGRYGKNYVDYLLSGKDPEAEFVGVIEKNIDASPSKEDILRSGVPVYGSLEEFYANAHADMMILSTPPFMHSEQSVYAAQHGSYVLSEKPAAPTVAQVEAMIRAEEETGKFIAVGYQWSFDPAILALKEDILKGVLGKPLSLKTLNSTPRPRAYYAPQWSGRFSMDGVMIMDSIAFNACAHYVHNLLFVLGDAIDTSVYPHRIEAECLRANDIESFDTCVLRMTTKSGVKLFFAASHATGKVREPRFVFEFENATVTYEKEGNAGNLIATFRDGSRKFYGVPSVGMDKIRTCMDAINAKKAPPCSAKTALAHTKLIEDLYHRVPVQEFSADRIKLNGDVIYVDGLFDQLCTAYDRMALLSELDPQIKATVFEA